MLIQELILRGVLSFGPETPALTMKPLNVLKYADGPWSSYEV